MNNLIQMQEQMNYSLADYLHYLDFQDNKIFFENESAAIVIKLAFIYPEVIDPAGMITIKEGLVNFLNSLDENLTIQFNFARHRNLETIKENHLKQNESTSKLVEYIFDKQIQKVDQDIQNKILYQHEIYLTIRKNVQFQIENKKLFSMGTKAISKEARKITDDHLLDLEEIQNKILSYLTKCKINYTIPNQQEVIDLVASWINLETQKNIDFKSKESLIFSDLYRDWHYCLMNNKYFSIMTFKNSNPPRGVYPGIITALIGGGLQFEYRISIGVRKLSKTKKIQELKFKEKIAHSDKQSTISGIVDKEKLENEAHIGQLLTDLVGQENLFDWELMIMVLADSSQELKRNCSEMAARISQMEGAVAYNERLEANFKFYLNMLPGEITFNNFRQLELKTSQVSDLLPVFGPPANLGNPLMFLRNRFDCLTGFDPVNTGQHGIVFGTTGGGKSFLVNYIVLGYIAKNPIIIIVDEGGSYKKTIQILNGSYFEVDVLKYSINPFDIQGDNKELFWKSLLETMIKDETQPGITNYEKVIIEKAIGTVLEQEISKPIISDFIEIIKTLDFNNDTDLMMYQKRIITYLERWTTGVKGKFLNQRINSINVESDVIGFDLKGLKSYPDIMEIFMFYITNVMWEKAALYKESREKLYLFDEAWNQFMTEQGSQLLIELYRTLRKYKGSVWTITQSIADFKINPKVMTAILENIAFYYILKQSSAANYKVLEDILGLNQAELKSIGSLTTIKGLYSEVFLRTPIGSMVAQIVPSPYEYWASTTDPNDLIPFNQLLTELDKNMAEILNELSEKYPHGYK